jgi:hypothetical protein
MTIEVREDGIIGRESYFHKRAYTQQRVRRSNGDTVFITAGDGAVVREVRRLLMRLARTTSLPMIVVSEWAKGIANKQEEAALQAELATIEEMTIPEPEAEINLDLAMMMFQRDMLRSADPGDSLEEVAEIAECQYLWAIFWAVRHPSPEVRADFAEMLAEVELLRAKTKAKADFLIARASRR